MYVLFPDPHHDGLSSSHSVPGHSPGVRQGARETDVASVEFSKESKRSHTDRGKTVLCLCSLKQNLFGKRRHAFTATLILHLAVFSLVKVM